MGFDNTRPEIERRRLLWGTGLGAAGALGAATFRASPAHAYGRAAGTADRMVQVLSGRPFYVVAASDAPQEVKDAADFVCDGVDDQAEVHAALALGNVQLTDGTYHVDPMIDVSQSDRWLRGTGPRTVVRTVDRDKAQGPENFGTINVQGLSTARLSNIWISDLTVDGNKDGQTGTAPGHPMDYGEGVELDYVDDSRVEDVIILNTVADGIDWDFTNRSFCRNLTIKRCGGFGMHVATQSHRTVIDGAHLVDTGLDDGLRGGFDLGTSNNMVSNVVVESAHGLYSGVLAGTDNVGLNVRVSGPGLRVGGTRVTLANFLLDGEDAHGWPALHVANAQDARLENFTIHSFTGATMLVENSQIHLRAARMSGEPAQLSGTAAGCLLTACQFPSAPVDAGVDNRFEACTSPDGSSDSRGSAVIPDGATTATVAHGLWATPAVATATPRTPEPVAVSARDDTTLTLARSSSSGDLSIDWTAHA